MSSLPISFELRERDGGALDDIDYRVFARELAYLGVLDHAILTPEGIINEAELSYTILHRGGVPSSSHDDRGSRRFFAFDKFGTEHWTAGLCCLHFPNPDDRSTAQIVIALLPEAREKGIGRAALHKLAECAFDVHRVHRVVASIVCPVRPEHSAAKKKQVVLETKRLCWVFEQYGFQFEGVGRGEVQGPPERETGASVWYDVYRMSLLETDHLATRVSGLFTGGTLSRGAANATPWDSMLRRHEEEERQMRMLVESPRTSTDDDETTLRDDYDDDGDDGDSDDDEGSGDYADPEDFDD